MIDLVVLQPTFIDFPLWRDWLIKNLHYFNDIVIGFDLSLGRVDYSNLLIPLYENYGIKCYVDKVNQQGDWRDRIIKQCLKLCNGNKILFMEQDFIVYNNKFLDILLKQDVSKYTIGFSASTRIMHPACLYLLKKNMESIDIDFGVSKHGDHFAWFNKQLNEITKYITLEELGFVEGIDWDHVNGCCHNYSLIIDKQREDFVYNDKKFCMYNKLILDKQLPSVGDFISYVKKIVAGAKCGL
jgi:hypothetical protein